MHINYVCEYLTNKKLEVFVMKKFVDKAMPVFSAIGVVAPGILCGYYVSLGGTFHYVVATAWGVGCVYSAYNLIQCFKKKK